MKKLVFYFYVSEDWKINKAYLTHFLCLQHYNEVFNNVEIYIAMDDKTDYTTIDDIKTKFLSIFKKVESIKFTVVDNTVYREGNVLKKYVIDKLGEDDLVFFAHTKGISNINDPYYYDEYVIKWIVGLYYFSLEDMDQVNKYLYNSAYCLSYGPFLTQLQTPEGMELKHLGKYKWYYAGSFYWINSKKLYNFIKRFNIEIPILDDRFYAENILANLYPLVIEGQALFASSYGQLYVIKFDDGFLNIEDSLKLMFPEGFEDFDNYFQDILKNVCSE